MSKFILSPGPTQCKPEFLETLAQPIMYHRCSDFHSLYKKTCDNLRQIIHLDGGDIFLLTSSGTGVMEASVSNFFNAGDHVLVISVGHFGNRFIEICESYNLNVSALKYDIGQTYDYAQVESFINENPDLKGVFITHHETSSGVLNNLEPVGKLVAGLDDCIFVVDSISGLLAHPMQMSDWGIDVMLAASQKGFLIPPGMAIAALSDKAVSRMNATTSPRYYFDLRKYAKFKEVEETPFTPNIPLVLALNQACEFLINDYGLENYYAHHKDLSEYLCEQLTSRGLDTSVVAPENRGQVLVAVRVKDGWNAIDIHDALDEKGYIIATGFGEYKPKILRIAVIGDVNKEDIDKFLVVFDQTISELYG